MTLLTTTDHHGIRLPSIGIGTWPIGGPYWTDDEPTGWGGPLDDEDSVNGLRLAIENGLTHIDTADAYGHGRSERLVARAISDCRSDQVIASKVGFVATSAPSVYSPENIRFQLEQTLRNLGVESVDIYYAHQCDFGPNDVFLSPAVEEFEHLKSEGLIRSIGLSGYSASDLIRIASALKPDFIQSWASIEHPEFILGDGQLASYMLENDIRFIAMMPFGQGRLLGKYDPKNPPSFEPGDCRMGNFEFSDESLALLEPRLEILREHFGYKPSDLITPALGFLLKHPVVISVVPGFRNTSQVYDLLQATSKSYSDADHAVVNKAFPFTERHQHPWSE
jgi:aryl-alcohol dehydrogenase-like predicted oxidoreductase